MCLLCIAFYTTWTQTDSPSEQKNAPQVHFPTSGRPTPPLQHNNVESVFVYTNHARMRMLERGANDNEVEDTVLTGNEVPARDGKQKFEKRYTKPCMYQGKTYNHKQVEVVTAKEENSWVVITVIADCM